MSNMSYCRFQNTALDLRDCLENMDDDELSDDEKRSRRSIITMACEIAEDYGYEVDRNMVEE